MPELGSRRVASDDDAEAPAAPPLAPSSEHLLLEFVRERDVNCPRCGYNLRDLTKAVCPECMEFLHLTVGVVRLRYEWLIFTLAPCIFSGIAAFFLGCGLVMANISPTGNVPWQPYVLDAFGWLSAIFALAIFLRRQWFLKLSRGAQATTALGVWLTHIAFFFLMWIML